MGGVIINPQAIRDNGRATQLAQGAKAGVYNREEFQALSSTANETTAMRARFAKDGLSFMEQAILNGREANYDQMAAAYAHGDYHPVPNPSNSLVGRQINQAGRIYDGLTDGGLTINEGVGLLGEQRSIAGQAGTMLQDGQLGFFDRAILNQRLDRSSGNIFEQRHNWQRDLPRWW